MTAAPARRGPRGRGAPSAAAAQEPFNQKTLRPLVNDNFRVSGTRECQNWTSAGNDRSGELGGNSWLTSNDRSRCVAALRFSLDLTFSFNRQLPGKLVGTCRLLPVIQFSGQQSPRIA